jgi:outer membrane biosynthesis protein TonB
MALTRSEIGGLVVAAAGHLVLFGILSVGFLATPNAEKLKPQPIAVSFAEDVGLESSAPDISSAPEAAKKSPVEAPVEPDSAPPEPVSEPEPVAKPQPAPPKPAPAPNAKPAPPSKPTTAAPAVNPRQQPRRNVRPTGNLEGLDLGRTNNRTDSTSLNPPATKMSAQAAADISSAIQRQVQPCADRQVNPGPGADQIRVVVNLRINRDGSLAGPPRIVGHTGVDDANQRYVTRVDDAVRAIFASCAPLRGLPAELYDVPNGWKSFTLRYRLKS